MDCTCTSNRLLHSRSEHFLCLSPFLLFVAGNAFPPDIVLKISDVVTLEDERREANNE